MLEHLIDFEPEVVAHSGKPTPLEKEHPADTIDAKVKTADWLKSLGAADTDTIGDGVGAAVGFDGQLVMPCRNEHKAFASSRCC